MTPGGVECEEEYSVSKQLLFAYLASPEVLDACDGQQPVVKQVSDFIRNYVSLVGYSALDFVPFRAMVVSL
jgi:hypothetical protein